MDKPTCSIDGCEKGGKITRGWCAMHYRRWRVHGDPTIRLQGRPPTAPPRPCSFEGCPYVGKLIKGYCGKHYQRLWKHGDPSTVLQKKYYDPEEAFNARTEWRGGCLEWTGATNGLGYGKMNLAGRLIHVHRYAWEREHGPIPNGLFIDHICHNPPCVYVGHLRLATRSENQRNRAGANAGSASGVRNVQSAGDGRFSVVVAGRHFGSFASVAEASPVAERARRELFGEFAGRG